MATLDRDEDLPAEFNATLRYHRSRTPCDDMVFQLAESLDLAREMSRDAARQVEAVLNGDAHPSHAELVRQCLQFHFRADVDSPPSVQKRIFSVLRRTADGLAGHIQLSEALNRYVWDLYEVYLDGVTLQEARIELGGSYRFDNPDYPRGGYVLEREWDDVFSNVTYRRLKIGSIHFEFSYAAGYPRPFLAMGIVHEATHKFARTNDEAYTDEDDYASLTRRQRILNADSYAYTALSLHLGVLITDLRMAIENLPQLDPTPPAAFERKPPQEV